MNKEQLPDVKADMEPRISNNWQIDKHVQVSVIAAIALQSAVAIWWAAGINGRVDVLERQAISVAPLGERLVKLETKFDGALESLFEIKTILRQVPTRSQP